MSTDVSGVIGKTELAGASGKCRPVKYDWSEVAHLFDDNEVP